MTGGILVLNAGSSSIKFALFAAESVEDGPPLYDGEIDGIGHAARLTAHNADGKVIADEEIGGSADQNAASSALLDWIGANSDETDLVAAGHRVAHGGAEFTGPVVVTPEVMGKLEELIPLVPLHQPHNLAAITALSKSHPDLPQVACFDTSFHTGKPHIATMFALPRELAGKGVWRYGFHGLSYEYIAGILPQHLGAKADGKVVVAHLGHGASMCAMDRRRSVATTMGFSALDGLVMGSRCGALDPGVILYLLQQENMTPEQISDLLYKQSGLRGVSGISDDMRDLLSSSDPRAEEAIELFVYRILRELGSLAAALGGLDALVFTGGIGEHAPEIRARVCRQAKWLGVTLDEAANDAGGPLISARDASVPVLTLATDEERVIARHTATLTHHSRP